MRSSTEVLASPPPRRRPVVHAVATVVCLGLVVWAVVARLSAGDPSEPAAAPRPPAGTGQPVVPALSRPPPWVRYPTPLEGRWVSTRPDRFTLVIRNAYVDMWRGVGQSQGQPLARRMMVVLGHRVLFRSLLAPDETATYRWRIAHERLRFRLLEQTATSAWSLAGLTFKPQV